MKEASWSDCIDSTSSLKVSPNKAKSNSLIETANGRIEFIGQSDLKENNANYIFEGYYSSILEFVHSLVILEGYKVNNHLCLGYYLRDVIKREDLFRLFDDCRFKRNSLMYYGKKLDFETAKETIVKCKRLIEELKSLLK